MSAKGRRQKLSLCLPAATIKKADLVRKIDCISRKLNVFQENIAHNHLIGLQGECEHKKGKSCWGVVNFKMKSDSTAFKICRSELSHLFVTSWVSWKRRRKSVLRLSPWRQRTERLKTIYWAQVKAEWMYTIKTALKWVEWPQNQIPHFPPHWRHAPCMHLSFRSRKPGKIC